MLPRTLTTSLFPYTTLFRSHRLAFQFIFFISSHHTFIINGQEMGPKPTPRLRPPPGLTSPDLQIYALDPDHPPRSEEHTSELQSREKLVCRLLLEKKKQVQF